MLSPAKLTFPTLRVGLALVINLQARKARPSVCHWVAETGTPRRRAVPARRPEKRT